MTKRNSIVLSALGTMFLFLVFGCTPSANEPDYVRVCPTMPTYTAAFEHQAAQQLAALPSNSPLAIMIDDYLAARKAARDCR